MGLSVSLVRMLDTVDPALREVLYAILEEIERQQKERVTKEEFKELKEVVKDLAHGIKELAEAQHRTEERLEKLIGEHKKTREQMGGLAHTVGYFLENQAYKALPRLLKRDFGIDVVEDLRRDYVMLGKSEVEINIIGRGRQNGNQVWILGECKTQLKKRDVDGFLKLMNRIALLFPGDKLYVMVTHQASPRVKEYLQGKGLSLYFSYQF